jgi:hypothetical protein
LATPNYGYEKRQRELAKKQKKEEKLRAKADRKPHEDGSDGDAPSQGGVSGGAPQGSSDPSTPR